MVHSPNDHNTQGIAFRTRLIMCRDKVKILKCNLEVPCGVRKTNA